MRKQSGMSALKLILCMTTSLLIVGIIIGIVIIAIDNEIERQKIESIKQISRMNFGTLGEVKPKEKKFYQEKKMIDNQIRAGNPSQNYIIFKGEKRYYEPMKE